VILSPAVNIDLIGMRSEHFTVFYFDLRKQFIASEPTSLKTNIKLARLLVVHCTLETLYYSHLAKIPQLHFSTLFCDNN